MKFCLGHLWPTHPPVGDRGLHEEDLAHQVELLPQRDLQNIRLEPKQEEEDELPRSCEPPPGEAWLARAGGQPGAAAHSANTHSESGLEFQTKVRDCETFVCSSTLDTIVTVAGAGVGRWC